MPTNSNLTTVTDSTTPPVVTTQPDEILRHSISDEELDMLCDSRSDLVLEILLVAVGAVLGTAAAALPAMLFYFTATPENPYEPELSDFIQILIFWAGLALVLAVKAIYKRRSTKSVSLRDQIRNRTIRQQGGD
jgi:hypothetical protein